MDNFLQNLHREIHTMDRLISKKEIESAINNLQKQKVPGPGEFIGELHQTFTVEIIPVLFQKIKAERILPNTALSHNKNFQLTRNRRELSQLDKDYPQKSYSEHYTQWWET